MKRRFLGRYNDLITRHSIYATDTAIEVDEQEIFEIVRKRVFFEDVLLVTMHERAAVLAIVATLGFAAFLYLVAAIAGGRAGVVISAIGLPFLILGIARIVNKDAIITVFGRRSKARIRFLRKTRARRIYEEICANVRRVQEEVAEEAPSPVAQGEGNDS